MSKNILADLNNLVKKASATKAAALKQAEDVSTKLDNAEDGTSPATTGAQAAAQVEAQKEQYAEPAADVNADDNKMGGSVEESTDEATAVSPSGQEGTEGSELAEGGIDEADNGPTMGEAAETGGGMNSGAFKEAAADLRKQAADLRKVAESLVSPLDRFLAKSARATDDPELKKHAEAVDDVELADAAADTLIEQLEAGELGDEEAAQILEEAVAAGAVSEEEIMEAADAVGGIEGEPEGEAEMLEAKLAAADIGPDHPEYLRKIASFYPAEIQAGYAFAIKLAEEMAAGVEEEEEAPAEGGEEPGEEAEIEVAPTDGGAEIEIEAGGEEAMPEGEEGGEVSEEAEVEGSLEDELTPSNPEEEAAMGAVGDELGLDPAAMTQLMAAPVPPEAEAEVMKVAKAMKTAGVSPEVRLRTLVLQKVAALRA